MAIPSKTSGTAKFSLGLVITGAILALVTLFLGVYSIEAGHVGLVKRYGMIVDVQSPGLHVKIPYVDSVDEIDMRERRSDFKLEAASADPLELPITVTLNWVPNVKTIADIYNHYGSLEQFEQRIIGPRVPDAAKGVISLYTVNDLLRKREEVRQISRKAIEMVLPKDVMTVTGFSVVNVGFPPKYTQQIQDKQVAREAAETEKFVLEKQKLTSQQITQSAEAERDAAKARADGVAYQIEMEGKAKAEAARSLGAALAQNPAVTEYRKVERWDGKFPDHFMGGDLGSATMWSLPAKTK